VIASADPLRLGLIGAGPWGRNYIRAIAGMDGVTLARLASRNPGSPALVDSRCRIDEDWRHLVSAGDLDGLIVATPPHTHAEITLAAVGADLPVLVEKPMTASAADAEAVVARAHARDAVVRVNHIHLYSAAWEALIREAGKLGPLRAVSTVAGRWGPFRPETPVLWDWAPHDVAMCMALMGACPDTARAHEIEARDTSDGPGLALALELDFGGVRAKIAISNMHREKQRLLIATYEGGELTYDDTRVGDDKLRLKTSPRDPGGTFLLSGGTPLERAVASFADAVRDGAPDWADAELGLGVVRVLEDLDRSLERDRIKSNQFDT